MSDYRVVTFDLDANDGETVVTVYETEDLVLAVLVARWMVWVNNDVVQIQRTADNAPIYACFWSGPALCMPVPAWIDAKDDYKVWMCVDGMPSPSNELWQHNVDVYFIPLAMQMENAYNA